MGKCETLADEMNDASVVLGRIEGKLDNLALQISYETSRGQDHEQRLRAIEKMVGAFPFSAFVTAANVVGTVVVYFLTR